MDPIHAKVGSDLTRHQVSTEDEFYRQHSCDWLLFARSLIWKAARISTQKRYVSKNVVTAIEH